MRAKRPVKGRAGRDRTPVRSEPVTLTIERLGTDGAGLARYQGQIVAVTGALPGENVVAAMTAGARAKLIEIRVPSPDRMVPVCGYFGRCGGCVAQHMAPPLYADFKHRRVTDALARVGLSSVPVLPTLQSPPASRRRATFEVLNPAGGLILGFHEAASHRIIDLAACPVLRPELTASLPAFRELLVRLLAVGDRGSLSLTLTKTGIDAGLRLQKAPDLRQTELLADFAQQQDLARLWVAAGDFRPVPISARRAPTVRPGGVAIEPPMGGFLQATEEGEAALVDLVRRALPVDANRIADLFSGIGTFALPLAAGGAVVHAVENDADALAALDRAWRLVAKGAASRGTITTERRDLDARPLQGHELVRFDAVIFDPPRAGARPQALALAASPVRTVVAVSCDPATFARDAAILVGGGFSLESVSPVDQFLWSSHIELVGRFRRR